MYDRFKVLGVPVKMTRTSDVDLEPNDRPGVVLDKFGNGKDVVVISNHINAGGAKDSCGKLTFFEKSKKISILDFAYLFLNDYKIY